MTRHRFPLALAAVALLSALAAYWAAGWWNSLRTRPVVNQQRPSAAATPAPAGRPREEVVIKSPTLKHTEGGRLAWQVRLKELKVSAGGQAVAAAGMREALIYDKNGAPIIRLTATQARGNTSDRNLEVSGNVRAVSPRGALITTEQVRWLEQERRLYCPGKVTMRSSSAAVTTSGLNYYVDNDLVKCPGVIRMYSGQNKLIGRQLVYNIKDQAFEMKNVQAVFNPQTVRSAVSAGRP